ncbi:hypothetical protein AB0N88_03690 [Streptomyces sp. NPDC093516]|uniref:hypothetical protein n=1 Tax=Streptomyces sp. NPDC093516 TaxID=3155304 RepID=UPI00341A12F8
MEILEDVWLAEPATLRFSRCNMFIGANGVGKTHLISLMTGFTAPSAIMERAGRSSSPVHAAITWYDPHPHRAEFRAEGENLRFLADGSEVPFVPQPYRVVSVPTWSSTISREVTWLAQKLGLDVWTTKKLALSVPDIVGGSVKHVSFVGKGSAARIKVEYVHGGQVITDEGGRGHRLSPIVGMEILIALAETHALATPTLLLVDGSLSSLDAEAFDHLTTLLSSPARGFQTVATLAVSARPLNPEWTVTRFVREPNMRRRNGQQATARLVQDGVSAL